MAYSQLLAMHEAASGGYFGGSTTDYFPGMTLTEATSNFPAAIMQWQIESDMANQRQNDSLVESVIASGGAIDSDALTESVFDGLINKIKSLFERLKKFVQSIITKLRVFIDRMTMDGKALAKKYQNSDLLKNKDFKDMTFMGYKFKEDIASQFEAKEQGLIKNAVVLDLVKTAVGSKNAVKVKPWDEFTRDCLKGLDGTGKFSDTDDDKFNDDKDNDVKKAAQEVIDAISDVDSSERIDNVMSEITNLNGNGNWTSELKEFFYGSTEKEQLEYKDGGDFERGYFSKNYIIKVLTEPQDLNKLKKSYEDMHKALEKQEKELRKQVTDFENGVNKGSQGGKEKKLTLYSSYCNAYISCISAGYSAIDSIKGAKTSALTDKAKQAKAIFGKMLSYKTKKSENSDFADEFVDDFNNDFDF